MANLRASNILSGVAANTYKSRFSNDDDDVSDDPAWYSVPRSSLQPAMPSLILKKHSVSSMTSSTDTGASSNPASPQLSSSGHESRGHGGSSTTCCEDSFPPEPPRRSMQIPITMRPSRTKQPERLSVQCTSLSTSLSSPLALGSSSAVRGSLSFDMGASIDVGATVTGSGYRECMMRYRPSDLTAHDMTYTLLTRDSLATELLNSSRGSLAASGLLSTSRGSTTHFGARPSDYELSDFLRAARTGNVMLLRAALQDASTDVTQRDPVHGQTALHIAVRFGQLAVVKLLCQKTMTRLLLLDSVDDWQNTPLHLAAAKSRRITKLLLEHGANVTAANARGQTPLGVHILTARRDEPLIAEMLLQHLADPNALLNTSTLLHNAVDLELFEIASRLVRYGARLDSKDELGKMVFEKTNRTVLRQLVAKIAFPPVWVPDAERKACMLCSRTFSRFKLGVRRHHCRHCGRLCCGECSHVSIERSKFPKAFLCHTTLGSGDDKQRACKTCSAVFKEREAPAAAGADRSWSDEFVQKVVGCTWDEIDGQKQSASRRTSVASQRTSVF